MPTRLACILCLVAFAACLVIGCFQAENTFYTTVRRALIAMGGTFVVSLVVGVMAQKMLEENTGGSTSPGGRQAGEQVGENKM